jgi:hypothetical protein
MLFVLVAHGSSWQLAANLVANTPSHWHNSLSSDWQSDGSATHAVFSMNLTFVELQWYLCGILFPRT